MNLAYLREETRTRGLGFMLRHRGVRWASRRAMANWALNELETRRARAYLVSNPTYVQIEPTTSCNLSCTMCGRETEWNELRHHARFLPWKVFVKTTPFLRTARHVFLHGWGESLLHPDLPEMVGACTREGAVVDVTTNGLLLHRDLADAVVAAGLDSLSVSLEGATSETYRASRGAELGTLVRNLEALAECKRSAGTPFPFVRFVFCIMKRNLGELVELVKLAHRCGVGEISINNLIVYSPDLAGQTVFGMDREVEHMHSEAQRLAKQLGVALIYKGIKPRDPKPTCPYASFTVLCDGSVGFCGAQRVLTGNIHDNALRDLWNGPAYQAARLRYATRNYPEPCQRCPNHTNLREDHESPDLSYVEETLAARRWDQADKRIRRLPMIGHTASVPAGRSACSLR